MSRGRPRGWKETSQKRCQAEFGTRAVQRSRFSLSAAKVLPLALSGGYFCRFHGVVYVPVKELISGAPNELSLSALRDCHFQ